MERERTGVYLYLAAVTGLAGVSILLLYLLYSAAVPDGFTAFVDAPGATLANSPRGVALVVATIVVIVLLVTTVIAFGARVTSMEADGHNDG